MTARGKRRIERASHGAEPYPLARRTESSAVSAPEVGEHDAREGARPCRACLWPAAELDGRQDCAHHRHRAGEVQDRDDEPRLHYPPAGSARADGGCARLSALTAGVRVASCKRRRGRRPGVKKVPDRGLTSARARGNAPSAKTEIAQSWYCSKSPAYAGTACATSITRARSTQSYFRRAHDQDRAIRKIKRETRSLVASGASLSTRSGGGRRVELLEKAFERTQPRFLARLPP